MKRAGFVVSIKCKATEFSSFGVPVEEAGIENVDFWGCSEV